MLNMFSKRNGEVKLLKISCKGFHNTMTEMNMYPNMYPTNVRQTLRLKTFKKTTEHRQISTELQL